MSFSLLQFYLDVSSTNRKIFSDVSPPKLKTELFNEAAIKLDRQGVKENVIICTIALGNLGSL